MWRRDDALGTFRYTHSHNLELKISRCCSGNNIPYYPCMVCLVYLCSQNKLYFARNTESVLFRCKFGRPMSIHKQDTQRLAHAPALLRGEREETGGESVLSRAISGVRTIIGKIMFAMHAAVCKKRGCLAPRQQNKLPRGSRR